MGAGALPIPGGNTGLALAGLPLLCPYAWLAFISICATIYMTLRLTASARDAFDARKDETARQVRSGFGDSD
jgi:hypothetical protein